MAENGLNNHSRRKAEHLTGKQNILGEKITQNRVRGKDKELADEKKDGYIRYINNRSSEEDRVYKGERNRPTDAIKQFKRTYWKRFSVEMEHDRYGGEKKIWNMLLKRKKPVIEEVVINAIDQETWATTYFENLHDNNSENSYEKEMKNRSSPREQY
ncbi:hypothetical protein HUJ04_000562 [Dendroctonus ponderosae]|nr:hypothetical protein HUJ04_000562 [Dendroctonus ponderosae]